MTEPYFYTYTSNGGEGWLGCPDLWSGQKPWWNWYLTLCGEFRWSPEGPVSQIHSPHLHVGAPGIFSDLLRSVQILKRARGAESNGKLSHLFILGKTAALVPEFSVEDLPLAEYSMMMILKIIIHGLKLILKNVCSIANPLHYYVLRIPRKMDRWR